MAELPTEETASAHQADAARRARLRWRSRRGLLENDIILTRFLDAHEMTLTDAEVAALTVLLDQTDNDLLDLLLDRKEIQAAPQAVLESPDVQALLARLRAA
ncbi:MAG: succinate dehydrogenase assembly factor 2 [Burkholderiales bacterium]|nr:succinate dehydrogenase assembly factor 2 [Burkholderiales bacterium]